jgi:hypothetical protein
MTETPTKSSTAEKIASLLASEKDWRTRTSQDGGTPHG